MSHIVVQEYEAPNMEVSRVFVGPFVTRDEAVAWMNDQPSDPELVEAYVAWVNRPSDLLIESRQA